MPAAGWILKEAQMFPSGTPIQAHFMNDTAVYST